MKKDSIPTLWGGEINATCSIDSKETIFFGAIERKELRNVRYNYEALLDMGCKYLISTDPFVGQHEVNLLKKFAHEASAWDIYLYEVKGR